MKNAARKVPTEFNLPPQSNGEHPVLTALRSAPVSSEVPDADELAAMRASRKATADGVKLGSWDELMHRIGLR